MATKRVYIPQRMNVQFPASDEYPGGRVVTLEQGYTDLTDEMQQHPVLCRLQGTLDGDADRQERAAAAQQKRDEAYAAADSVYAEEMGEIQKEEREEREKVTEDWAARRDQALSRGEGFTEMHPDPETRRAYALTGPAHVIPSEALRSPTEDAPKQRQVDEPKKATTPTGTASSTGSVVSTGTVTGRAAVE